MSTAGSTLTQNAQFTDQNVSPSLTVDSTVDPTRKIQDSSDATLQNFFSRPVRIHEEAWDVGQALSSDLAPWHLYFTNKRVSNRIANYKLLRATLKLKVVVNGNGFYYGRAMMSYLPMIGRDNFSLPAVYEEADLVQMSQRPKIFIDPTTSTGGEMTLPFFWDYNYMDITNANYTALGGIYLRSFQNLKHANGGDAPVRITIFAWAEDVELAIPTSIDPTGLTPQSGDEVDEANSTGVISGPATAIAKAASALSTIPPIAPFMRATAGAANMVSSTAKLLGYSRPPVTKNPEPARLQAISQLATTTTPDTAHKLTVDDKQELSIDPGIAGIGRDDPMSIKGIASRESFLTTFDWAANATADDMLWNTRVIPGLYAIGSASSLHLPACAAASLPFEYWTGTIKFRFQIVCSAFHRGRLKIVYDPDYISGNEFNVNYLEIVDISEKQDFTISVGPGQEFNWMRNLGIQNTTTDNMYGTTPFAATASGNGVLGIYVLNTLTTPNPIENVDISVNVFVSAGDDFEVSVPDNDFQRCVFKPQSGVEFDPQSGEIGTDVITDNENNMPEQTDSTTVGPDMAVSDMMNNVFIGEKISSFRPLLKRYALHRIEQSGPDNQNNVITGSRSMFPFYRGNITGAVDLRAGQVDYNFCNTLLLHWVQLMYSGWRGSIRTKILTPNALFHGLEGYSKLSVNVERAPINSDGAQYSRVVSAQPAYATNYEAAQAGVYDSTYTNVDYLGGTLGQLYADENVNGNVEFESPFYSQLRFVAGKPANYTSDGSHCEGYRYVIRGNTSAKRTYQFHHAIGEDFQLYFFTAMPRLYIENSPPAPYTGP